MQRYSCAHPTPGYASKVALQATSGGGLVAGALLNQCDRDSMYCNRYANMKNLPRHPHLVCALVANVPFVDLVGSMSNPALPLTVHEYAEHGDPNNPQALVAVRAAIPAVVPSLVHKHAAQMKAVCPVSNVKAQVYPRVMVAASLDDTRVPYWGPCAWVDKLQAANADKRVPVLLYLTNSGGHFGFEEDGGETRCMQTAFLFDAVAQ